MEKALKGLPVLDHDALHARADGWRKIVQSAGPGGNRVVIEWLVNRGPNCFVFPAGKRAEGVNVTAHASHRQSDERWADFLEFDFIPQVEAALKDLGFTPQVICADLRPVQIMRQRRRTIEALAHAKTGGLH